jgi:hypothetical protein
MKAKQDWQFIGRFVGTSVQLFTIISSVFKNAKIGMEAMEWCVGLGRTFLIAKLTELVNEYKRQHISSASKIEELPIDPIIRVDRSIRPSYPDWAKTVMHPELESVGPAEYDITKVKQWLHDGQEDGKWIEGNRIYTHLKDTNTLKTCLGLRDLEEIQKKGITFFRTHFKGKAVFGWASVVRSRDGDLRVSCLYESGGEVVLNWLWLGDDWDSFYPGLRHASSPQA